MWTWIFLYCVFLLTLFPISNVAYRTFSQLRVYSTNYKGETIIQSFGILLFVHFILFVLYAFTFQWLWPTLFPIKMNVLPFTLLSGFLMLMGLMDDKWGNSKIKGFKGHVQALTQNKEITTGLLKAFFGFLISLSISIYYSTSIATLVVHLLTMLFSIHFFNLLDVRPCRAIKIFWILLFIIFPLLSVQQIATFVLPIIMSTAVFFRFERKLLVMLGDAGSNLLGGIFGYYLILVNRIEMQIPFLLLFMLLSLYAEREGVLPLLLISTSGFLKWINGV